MLGPVVIALLLALTPMFGCAAPTPSLTKPDKVVLHHFGDLSGPYAAITAPIVSGFEDFAQWFIRWGVFRTLAWVCLLVVPVVELWGLLWWRYSLGVWQWHHPAHLAGFLCGIAIVALLPARITMGSRAEYF